MTRRFAVAMQPISKDEESKFLEKIKPVAWWHWLPNFWLLKDTQDHLTAVEIRNILYDLPSQPSAVVLEIDRKTWASIDHKNKEGRSLSDWLKETWPD